MDPFLVSLKSKVGQSETINQNLPSKCSKCVTNFQKETWRRESTRINALAHELIEDHFTEGWWVISDRACEDRRLVNPSHQGFFPWRRKHFHLRFCVISIKLSPYDDISFVYWRLTFMCFLNRVFVAGPTGPETRTTSESWRTVNFRFLVDFRLFMEFDRIHLQIRVWSVTFTRL